MSRTPRAVHVIRALVTLAPASVPLPPPASVHVCAGCVTAPVVTVTVYDAPSGSAVGKVNAGVSTDNDCVVEPGLCSATTSPVPYSPWTVPPTVKVLPGD